MKRHHLPNKGRNGGKKLVSVGFGLLRMWDRGRGDLKGEKAHPLEGLGTRRGGGEGRQPSKNVFMETVKLKMGTNEGPKKLSA